MSINDFPLSAPNHAGQPNDPADVFFGDIDRLGPIISAQTNCNSARGRRNWTASRLAATLGGMLLGSLLGVGLAAFLENKSSLGNEWLWAMVAVGALAGAILLAWIARPWEMCTLVGQKGLALIKRRGQKVKQQTLLFEQANQLRQKQTRVYYNGIYLGTNYFFDWLDQDGRRLFRIGGSYREKRKKPLPPSDLYYFALAAEEAWLRHRWPAVEEAIKRHAPVRFSVGRDDYLEVGDGYLEIKDGKKARRLADADIEKVFLKEGKLIIKPRGGGWFSSYRIPSERIADLKLVLLLLERFMPQQ